MQERIFPVKDYLTKIKTKKAMKELVRRVKQEGKKIVFTNGCFDILHQGHVRYLYEASNNGDYLIVGLNSDKSVRINKGKNRPLISEEARSELIAALCFVDGVVIFNEETPIELIRYLMPHILAKGADWAESDIVGSDLIKRSGGEVIRIPLVSGVSTSEIIRRVISLKPEEK